MSRNQPPKSRKPANVEKLKPGLAGTGGSKKRFLILALVVILAGIPFSMGKYIEFNSPGPFDSGAYVYSAAHIVNGAEIGPEEKPSARLGTLLVNMLGVWLFGYNETGPEIIQMIMQAAALVLMFAACRKLFGTLSAAVGVIVASTFLSSPLFAKFGNVKEQYMIACMVLGMSSFILYQLGGKWWWALLAGAFLSWAPLFKETGTTAIGAVGLFVILQPFLKNRTFKQTGIDICLLFAGAAIALGPLYIWIIGWDVRLAIPYKFAWTRIIKWLKIPVKLLSSVFAADTAAKAADTPKKATGYLARSREMIPFSVQCARVFRYYSLVILPITLAIGAILARIVRLIRRPASKEKIQKTSADRFVLLLAVWWLLDMAFVWISPRSYEQYYLPLNASAAMLGGYLLALYWDKTSKSVYKGKWIALGAAGLVVMVLMSWHVFFGIGRSAFSGTKYPEKRKGYAQMLKQISQRRARDLTGAWEVVGRYIRTNSQPTDKMYVWGWYPGIYIQAQRFSPVAHACMMPRPAPKKMSQKVASMLEKFKQDRPRFIVDSRKNHIPLERPPYELWPRFFPGGNKELKSSLMDKRGFLKNNEMAVNMYEQLYAMFLKEMFDEDESLRYEHLKPFRDFIRNNYRIVRMFGQHVLFELK
ncbi:ArnT family glycosyltransferase [Planctomycetota bacterium]